VQITLYILSLIGSGAGFMTQMLVSGFWTTAFSQDVFYYSINLATYLLALGLGSLLSNYFKKTTLKHLGILILSLLWVSGLAIPFLKMGIKGFGNNILFPLAVVSLAGVLNGMVIPLTLKIGSDFQSISLALLFFVDYSAATVFTFIFTFVLLIPLGYSKTALILSLGSTVLVALTLFLQKQLSIRTGICTGVLSVLSLVLYFTSGSHIAPKMDKTGTANIIYSEQSHYQKIILTEEPPSKESQNRTSQHVLFLDGFVQFSSVDEANYHLCLADVPMGAAGYQKKAVKEVLILGGGDGLAARNFLKTRGIEKVTLVELDPAMIRLAKEHPIFRKYNLDSLNNPKVEVIVADAFRWVQENRIRLKSRYDLIIIDFPAPKNLTLARLFSAEFYQAAFELLAPKGFVSIQSGPSYSYEDPSRITLSKVTASILETIESIGYRVFPYVTPLDSEAFVLVTSDPEFKMDVFSRKMGIYTGGAMSFFCRYDTAWVRPKVEINTLNTLKLSQYMIQWFNNASDIFFYYRGNHAVFLPE